MEIAIYAILAAFIFSRLYYALGKVQSGYEINKKVIEVKNILEEELRKDCFLYVTKEKIAQIAQIAAEIRAKDKNFSTDKFISGAEMAFEAIINAFAGCDKKILRALLDDNIFNILSAKIQKRQSEGLTLQNTIVSINSKELTDLELNKGTVLATVKFKSEQINITQDESGSVVSGDPKVTEVIEDVWKFKRHISSLSPKWLVFAMN